MSDSHPDQPLAFFYWKDISIEQDERVWKAGTDAILLGTWIPKIIDHANSILDIGTGSGILLLMLAGSFPNAKLTGIDNHLPAIELAKRNTQRSAWHDRIQIVESSLDAFCHTAKTKFELIVSNPPFFVNQVSSPIHQRLVSKHTSTEPGEWIQRIKNLLADRASVCLILPPIELNEWIKVANEAGLYVSRRLNIYSFEKDEHPKRVIVLLTGALVKARIEQLVMYEKEDRYTAEYAAWLQA